MMIVYVVAGLLLWMFYKFWISVYKTWELRGFPFLAGSFPFGTDRRLTLLTQFQGETLDQMYRKTDPSPYFGIYIFRLPFIVIRDPEIIGLVMAKDFSHFRDRQGFEMPKQDPLSHHLFNLEGDRWRALRIKMSPTFSSGKLKAMFQRFVECSDEFNKLLLSKVDKTVDVKDLTSRFTTDTICSCAFGLEVNSIKHSEIALRELGPTVLAFSLSTLLKISCLRSFPSLMKRIGVRFTPKKVETYLLKLIKETMDHRKKNGVKRNDFLDILIELKEKGKLPLHEEDVGEVETDHSAQEIELTTELITAQCFVFFIAGFETSSSVQSYCLYEMAVNPDIQEKVYKEIETTVAKHGGVTYQAVQEMEYLDMVIHETMRKYPTLPLLTRRCTKPFSMPAGNKILVGDKIIIPTWSLHHDPEYFPNPEKFDPERFSAENKQNIKPYSYLPFGEGPRICIGRKFGLLQTKVGLISVLRNYQVSPCERTDIPLKFAPSFVITSTDGTIELKISSRAS